MHAPYSRQLSDCKTRIADSTILFLSSSVICIDNLMTGEARLTRWVRSDIVVDVAAAYM